MGIYGYFVSWIDTTDGDSHKDYGFVAAESRADAIVTIENQYEGEWSSIEEIGVSTVQSEDDNPAILDKHQIAFFVDTMEQNGYGEEGN